MTTTYKQVTRNRPCPVCEGDHKCSLGADDSIQCGRVPDGLKVGQEHNGHVLLKIGSDPQFGTFRAVHDPELKQREEERRREWEYTHRRQGGNGVAHHGEDGSAEAAAEMEAKARALAANLTPERSAELARVLGLPESALSALPLVGYSPTGFHRDRKGDCCWTFAEVNGEGKITGIVCRYADGSKPSMPGSARGVYVPAGWREREGPVFLVEGASDTLTLTAIGLAALGRPNNRAGVDQLRELLRDVPADRPIIVVGEYDPKPNGTWPGRDGMVDTAAALARGLGRPVAWALPPDGAKDVRNWVHCQEPDPAISDEWHELGDRLRAALVGAMKAVEPEGDGKPPEGFAWRAVDLATLAGAARRPEMLVKRLVVRNQPMIVGAPHKTLKTSVMCDLAVSLATGTPFLGTFNVYRPVKVALFSGESGEWTLTETFRRVCVARGIDFASTAGRLLVQAEGLPQLSNAEHMDYLRLMLDRERVEVFILDPLYLTLLSGMQGDPAKAANLYAMGPLFQNVARACLDVGATPKLVHHTQRAAARSRDPLGLEDLAYAGVAEFARQWLLLSRREDYDGARPGTHKLWMNAGGSAGHGGLWALDIEEGEAGDNLDGRVWDVAVSTATDARQAAQDGRDADRREENAAQDREDEFKLMAAVDQLTAKGDYHTADGRPAAGYTKARDLSAVSGRKMVPTVARLVKADLLREAEVRFLVNGRERTGQGLQRVEDGS
jgi:replicative DNA helicase